MEQILTLRPEDITHTPTAEWSAPLIEYMRAAAEAGEVITVSAKVETLTPAQVADRLGVSRPTIVRRIAAGDLKVFKVGNRNRIPIPEFERFRDTYVREMASSFADDF